MTELEEAEAECERLRVFVQEMLHWRSFDGSMRRRGPEQRRRGTDAWSEAVFILNNGESHVPSVQGCPRDRGDYERENNEASFELDRARYLYKQAKLRVEELRSA